MSTKKSRKKSKRGSEEDGQVVPNEGSNGSGNPPTPALDGSNKRSNHSFTVIDFIDKEDDKTPKSCRSTLCQLSLTSIKMTGASIGRPVLLKSQSGRQEVCLGWPVAQFPPGKVGLPKSVQMNLKLKTGDEVVLQPLTGPLLPAAEVLLTSRCSEKLDSPEFKDFLLRSFDSLVILPGGLLSLSYFGRSCDLRVESVTGLDDICVQRPDLPDVQDSSLLDCTPADLSLQLSRLMVDASTPCRPSCQPSPASTPAGSVESLVASEPLYTAVPAACLSSEPFYFLSRGTRVTINGECCPRDPEAADMACRRVTYSMIGGLSGQLSAIRETVELPLKHPELYTSYGIPPPRGVLLYGPPGTGKTMIGRAIATEVGAHMAVINGPEIMSKFYGETEERLRNIFAEAAQRTPAIVFIDELDALCPMREGAQNEVEKRVVASLLTLMDGIGSEGHAGQLLVLGATNRPHALDPALRRPGRFDKELEVGIPGAAERADILRKQLSLMACSVSLEEVAELAELAHGYVGADLAAVCQEAALHALKRVLGSTQQLSDLRLKGEVTVTLLDLRWAMTLVKPSAMREVAIDVPQVGWSDVGGMEEVKLQLKQAVEWPLRHPGAFPRMGIQPPKGVLLYGPPGCSKTMIAKALANESGLNFLSVKGPELLSKFVGESERAIREVFRKARAVAPSIVFFDEIDALASERGSSPGSGGVGERILAQLLTEMDGVERLGNVTVLAATNRPDMIDQALMRPGRLDRIVYVPLPDVRTRQEIFCLQFRNTPVASDISVEDLAIRTENYSGAEITAVCREAALLALQEDMEAQEVKPRHLQAALALVPPRIPDSLIQLYLDYQQQHGGPRVSHSVSGARQSQT